MAMFSIMVMDPLLRAKGEDLVEEIKAPSKEAQVLNDLIYEMLDKNCGQVPNCFKLLVHEKGHADWYLEAVEATKHNLATLIGVPKFVAKVFASMDVVL